MMRYNAAGEPRLAVTAQTLQERLQGHIQSFINEATIFPFGAHDDMLDAASKAYAKLTSRPRVAARKLGGL